MDSKRKANGAAPVETEDRAAKRRKLAEFDLSKGETPESTTAYGLSFLEQIRRTTDKSGRLVATYFEELLPREGNAEYYKRTRMPISLQTIEEKLNDGKFKTLAELESYFKRMIANAKEFYPRSSLTFDDAERIRKALSNYMTKTNPAYGTRGYQAVPTPLPPESGEEGSGDEDDEEEDAGEQADEGGDGDDAAQDEEEDKEAEEEEEEEEEEEPSSRRRSIILKRRGSSRATRNSMSQAKESSASVAPSGRPDHQYESVPYSGLSFQQAQEKLVEELLRHKEPEYEDVYFEPFVNLPPRALKDYYKVISDPLSIKKLQKMVKGVHGRHEATGSSDFKTWAALEEKSKLLWDNAYFYNEEGSEIYSLAQDLEKFFYVQLKKAQAAVPEPAQPKIKLKVGQAADATPMAKKITIHVGNRGDSVDSPAPPSGVSVDAAANGQSNGASGTATPARANLAQVVDSARNAPGVSSPSPSTKVPMKAEDGSAPSPANVPRPPSAMPGQATPGTVGAPVPIVQPQPVQQNHLANGYLEQKRLRTPGKGMDDALISKVRVLIHPNIHVPNNHVATVLPHPTEMQQSATVSLPASLNRVFLITTIPDFLRERQYSLWTLVNKQPLKPIPQHMYDHQPNERVFEAVLHPGVNVFESHLIAAIPRSERVSGGPEVELEVFNILINVQRN